MFFKHPEGTTELVYEVEVNIPPVGVVWDYENKEWIETGVMKIHSDPLKQKWQRIEPHFNYEEERELEEQKQKSDPDYFDPKLEAWREEEWSRRRNGMWFMVKGNPVYITGLHWYYLSCIKLDVGYPNYRNPDRRLMLLWQWCVENPRVYGEIEAACRRSGKTFKAIAMLLEAVSRKINAQGGIQSLTTKHALSFYQKMTNAFKHLPDYFQPIYDHNKIKSVMSFTQPVTRKKLNKNAKELNSFLQYGSSDPFAFDSQKQVRYVRDEFAKVDVKDPSNNIVSAWQVVKPTMSLGSRNIVGKALFTSTVEEGGSEPAQELWLGSDWSKRDETTGETQTGLVRVFTPAYENDESFFDEWGFCNEEESRAAQQAIRNSLAGNPRQLASYMRKFPWKIEEAFFLEADLSPFNILILNEQLLALKFADPLYIRGKFQWKDGIEDGTVIFVPNEKGRFYLHSKVDHEAEHWNNVEGEEGERKIPRNSRKIVMGVDPFDSKVIDIVDKQRMSMGACYVFHKYDGLDEELSETFLCEYVDRPDTPDEFYEDCLMAAHFFGCRVLVENNKEGMINYFDRRGYSSWLVKPKGKTQRGISAGEKSKEQLVEEFTNYTDKNAHKIPFPRLVADLLNFDPKNSTKNDSTMAAGWALVAAYRIDRRLAPKKNNKRNDSDDNGLSLNDLSFI